MIRRFISVLLLLAAVTGAFSSAQATIPEVQEVITPKKLTAWVIEDHYLPIISLRITFENAGFAYDPADKAGVAFMVASMLDEGAGNLSSLDYKKQIEALATTLSFSVDEDRFYISLQTLTQHLPEALSLLRTVLTEATFDDKALDRIRGQILVLLTKQQEDPQYIAAQKFKEIMFGNHPYSKTKYGHKETINALTRDDLVAFVMQHFTQENLSVSVAGDVSGKTLSALLDDTFSSLPQTQHPVPAIEAPILNSRADIVYIDYPIPQSVILFGTPGLLRNDPDFYPAYIMNHILGGGGFESRLTNEVREKNGLAYSIYSYLDTLKHAGLLAGYVGTANENTEQAIRLIKEQIVRIKEHGVTEAELRDAKDYLLYSFPLKMTKNANLTSFMSGMQQDELGIDFLQKRNDYVQNVSIDEVDKAAYELLDVNKMLFVVVGGTQKNP